MNSHREKIEEVLKKHPRMVCLIQCLECEILFLTSIANKDRSDIRCPYGCRRRHSNKKSNQRSTSYYQTEQGKAKKKAINDKRDKSSHSKKAASQTRSLSDKVVFGYYRWLILVIQRIRMNPKDIRALIERARALWRQQGLDGINLMSIVPDG